jgi:hypothetical protein
MPKYRFSRPNPLVPSTHPRSRVREYAMAARYCNLCVLAFALTAATARWSFAQDTRPGAPTTAKSAAKKSASQSSQKPPLVIGPDTTRISGPLRTDGYPDYFAALDNHVRRGVSSADNAAVLLIQAFGLDLIPPEISADYFASLGIKPLPPAGDYFVRHDEMRERWIKGAVRAQEDDRDEDTLQSQFALAGDRPWSPDDYPLVAQWLAINEAPLQLITKSAHCPRFYEPILPANQNLPALWNTTLPLEQSLPEIKMALAARAMLRLKAGDLNAAWNDLVDCQRLLRQMAAIPAGQYADQARLAEIELCQTELLLLHAGRPNAKQIDRLRVVWDKLPPMPGLIDRIDLGDRYRFLNLLCLLDQKGPAVLQQILGDSAVSAEDSALQKAASDTFFDWNEPLKMGNQWFDRQVAICRLTSRHERQLALEKSAAELRQMADDSSSPGMFALNWFTKKSAKAAFGRIVGATLIQLLDSEPDRSLVQSLKSADQHAVYFAMAETGLALAAYRADHDEYPEDLSALTPRYANKLRADPYALDKPLCYHRQSSGYLLYSVGPDGLDQGGGESERYNDSDDIAVSISDPEPPPATSDDSGL